MSSSSAHNETIVLAYSGGLDTSALIPWLKEKYGYDVVACLVDLGRVKDIPAIMERATASGAIGAEAIDAKEEFAEHHCLPALMANALYEDKYPLSTAIGRPVIAKKLVETAHKYGATAVAHGCTRKGNDQVRIDIGVRALDPNLAIIAPARAADWPSREELLDYVAAHDIPIALTKKSPYSIDENMWGRSDECGVLEDPWVAPPEDAFQFAVSAADAPDEPQHVVVSFEKGKPVALDGTSMGMVELVLWASAEFGFIHMPDAFSGGSSIMPQKKNPDAAELMRAAAPRLSADLGGLLGVLHGLPLAYNTDLREDKRYLFDAVDCLDHLLPVVRGLLGGVTFDEARLAAACDPFLAATDVADYLVDKGVPFREAHHLTGALVRRCLEAGTGLGDASLDALRELSPVFDEDYYGLHEPAAQLARKRSRGGCAAVRVREQLELAMKALAAHPCC